MSLYQNTGSQNNTTCIMLSSTTSTTTGKDVVNGRWRIKKQEKDTSCCALFLSLSLKCQFFYFYVFVFLAYIIIIIIIVIIVIIIILSSLSVLLLFIGFGLLSALLCLSNSYYAAFITIWEGGKYHLDAITFFELIEKRRLANSQQAESTIK